MEGGAAGRKLGPTCSRSNHHYPRVALVGDAAHAIDPVLAQGTGVAIEDAAQLAASIARIQQDPSSSSYTAAAVGAAVASYEESRAGRVRVLAAVSDLSQFFGQIGTTTTPSLSPPMPSDGGGGGAVVAATAAPKTLLRLAWLVPSWVVPARDLLLSSLVPQVIKGPCFDAIMRWSLGTDDSIAALLIADRARSAAYQPPSELVRERREPRGGD